MAVFLVVGVYVRFFKRKKVVEGSLLRGAFDDQTSEHIHGNH